MNTAAEQYAIQVKNLSKKYRFNNTDLPKADNDEGGNNADFWALKNINLNIKQGEVVGLIGKNGAGKSTLLKLLSGITKPTTGTIKIKGTTGSMLEVGTGFNPDLTGRENVLMNGLLLGMNRKDIEQQLEAIVAFSGVGKFIDTQVKHYSSGMYVRLAFSVLVNLKTDILLLDEVLTVGDAEFRTKSYESIAQIMHSGRTVVLASHNPQEVQALCTRVVWIEGATVRMDGAPQEVIEQYLLETYEKPQPAPAVAETSEEETTEQSLPLQVNGGSYKEWKDTDTAPGNDKVKLLNASIRAKGKDCEEPVYMEDEIAVQFKFFYAPQQTPADAPVLDVFMEVYGVKGEFVLADCPALRFDKETCGFTVGINKVECTIPALFLNVGVYFLTLRIIEDRVPERIANFERVLSFRVSFNEGLQHLPNYDAMAYYNKVIFALTRPNLKWNISSE